jgi:hypothetical protein
MNRALRPFLVALMGTAAIWTVARMAHEGAWVSGWAGMSAMARTSALSWSALTLLPFALLALTLARPNPEGHRFAWVAAIAVLTVGGGAFMIWQALDVVRGDQRGLIFLFVPPAQLVGAVLALAVSVTTRRRVSDLTAANPKS